MFLSRRYKSKIVLKSRVKYMEDIIIVYDRPNFLFQ